MKCSNCGRRGHKKTTCSHPSLSDYYELCNGECEECPMPPMLNGQCVRRINGPVLPPKEWDWVNKMLASKEWLVRHSRVVAAFHRYRFHAQRRKPKAETKVVDMARVRSFLLGRHACPECSADILDSYKMGGEVLHPLTKPSHRSSRHDALEEIGYFYKDFTGDWNLQRQYYGY